MEVPVMGTAMAGKRTITDTHTMITDTVTIMAMATVMEVVIHRLCKG